MSWVGVPFVMWWGKYIQKLKLTVQHSYVNKLIELYYVVSLFCFGMLYLFFSPSRIYSLIDNKSSAEGVYGVFVALQVNPSLQKLKWVAATIYVVFTCEELPIEFHLLLYTCMDGLVDPGFRVTVLREKLCAFLTRYYVCNKISSFGINN